MSTTPPDPLGRPQPGRPADAATESASSMADPPSSIVVSIVLAGAILWLLYRRDATEYYDAVSARVGPDVPPGRTFP